MSGTAPAPPLNAEGGDPVIQPPAPPPIDASNDPADRARGVAGEASADALAAVERARRGEPPDAETVDPRNDVSRETKDSETDPAESAAEKPDPKPDTTPPWMKAEITKERNARRAADEAKAASDARAEAAQKRLDEALAAVAALTPKPPPEPIAEPRPQRDAFSSPDAYDQAIEQWATRNAEIRAAAAVEASKAEAAAAATAAEQERTAAAQADFVAKTEASWKTRRDAFAAATPDFAEFAEFDTVQITPEMGFAIKVSETGPQLAYHLGKNPEEAARIAALPPFLQAYEMGGLAKTLAQPRRAVVSNAPRPVAPISGTTESPVTDREESMAEVAARVAKREAGNRIPIIGARPH